MAECNNPTKRAFDKASNRAVVYDDPVKLAAFGLGWRRAEHPRTFAFTSTQSQELAKAEHRRWQHVQRRNGRARHRLCIPWDLLSPDQQTLDLSNAEKTSAILA